ncbi:hypothetical protein ATC04_10955 [Arthrobacter sp. YC-RL1]|nr:hypothetical protein ATC04_10955 [Arthrobacter sp. YC-RL1]
MASDCAFKARWPFKSVKYLNIAFVNNLNQGLNDARRRSNSWTWSFDVFETELRDPAVELTRVAKDDTLMSLIPQRRGDLYRVQLAAADTKIVWKNKNPH